MLVKNGRQRKRPISCANHCLLYTRDYSHVLLPYYSFGPNIICNRYHIYAMDICDTNRYKFILYVVFWHQKGIPDIVWNYILLSNLMDFYLNIFAFSYGFVFLALNPFHENQLKIKIEKSKTRIHLINKIIEH